MSGGTKGVPIGKVYSLKDIKDALIKNCGIVTHAAHQLGIARNTVYTIINQNPELKPLIDKLRTDYDTLILDQAEETLRHSTSHVMRELDPPTALKAAMYILNTKGRVRGYVPAEVAAAREAEAHAKTLNLALNEMQEFAEWRMQKQADQRARLAAIGHDQAAIDSKQSGDQGAIVVEVEECKESFDLKKVPDSESETPTLPPGDSSSSHISSYASTPEIITDPLIEVPSSPISLLPISCAIDETEATGDYKETT